MAFATEFDFVDSPAGPTADGASAPAESHHDSWPLALVLRRRRVSGGAWEADSWSLAAIDSEREQPSATVSCDPLDGAPGTELYRWRGLVLQLHRDERAAYRFNLGAARPRLFVNCNADERGRMVPKLVTACQDDAAAYMDGGDDDVLSIEMPLAIQCWIEAFLARHGEAEVALGKGRHRQRGGAREGSGSHG